jgi:hypothetical protein
VLLTVTSHSCRNTVLAVIKPTSCSSPYGPTAANAAQDQILQEQGHTKDNMQHET